MIHEINKIDSRKLPLKSLQPKSKARRSHPWLFQSLSKPQVYLVTPHLKHKSGLNRSFLAFKASYYTMKMFIPVSSYKVWKTCYYCLGIIKLLNISSWGILYIPYIFDVLFVLDKGLIPRFVGIISYYIHCQQRATAIRQIDALVPR